MMATLRPLDPPHKGLRNAMAQFQLLIGQTDFADADAVAHLRAVGDEVFLLLADHARTEDAHVLAPLDQRVPGSSELDLHAHGELEATTRRLRDRLAALDGRQTNDDGQDFLLDFSTFHAEYLLHMAGEERTTEPLVMAHFTDEELIADQGVIMQEMDFGTLLLWFKYIVPARRLDENALVLSAFKAAAPAETFDAASAVLEQAMPPAAFKALMAAVNGGDQDR